MAVTSTASSIEVLAGLVDRVTFHNSENGFCVLRVKARGQRDLITVVGHAAMISAGEFVQASGGWVNDRTHGVQFRASFLKATAPTTVEGIEKYLVDMANGRSNPEVRQLPQSMRAEKCAVDRRILVDDDRRRVGHVGPRQQPVRAGRLAYRTVPLQSAVPVRVPPWSAAARSTSAIAASPAKLTMPPSLSAEDAKPPICAGWFDRAIPGHLETPNGQLLTHFPVIGSSPHLIGLEYQQSSKSVLIADLGKGVVWKVDPETHATSMFARPVSRVAIPKFKED